MEARKIYNALDPTQNDPVEVLINATRIIDFLCEHLTHRNPDESYEISSRSQSGLFYILDSIRWSLEGITEELMKETEEPKIAMEGEAQEQAKTR